MDITLQTAQPYLSTEHQTLH